MKTILRVAAILAVSVIVGLAAYAIVGAIVGSDVAQTGVGVVRPYGGAQAPGGHGPGAMGGGHPQQGGAGSLAQLALALGEFLGVFAVVAALCFAVGRLLKKRGSPSTAQPEN
jgi:hypothetical protein